MRKVFCPALLLAALGCGGPEDDYPFDAAPCDGCRWVLPLGTMVNAQQLVGDGKHLYWIQSYTQQLLRVKVGGGEIEQVSGWLERSAGLLVDDAAIYTREADPPVEFAARLVRVDKVSGEQSLLSEGNVVSSPTLVGSELLYFEQRSEGVRLVRQQTSSLVREVVLEVSRSRSPTAPVMLGGSLAFCSFVDAAVSIFRSPLGASAPEAAYVLPEETSCPELFERDGQLFGFSQREDGSLLELAQGGPRLVKTGMIAETSARFWGLTSLAGGGLLLAQLGGTELRMADAAGEPVWAGEAPFGILVRAVADADEVYLAGERAIAGFRLPAEASP